MPKATREAGPATATDDTPTRDKLIEALVNLRAKSEAEYIEWQRLKGMNYIGPARTAYAKWSATHAHIDNMLDGIQFVDMLSA